MVLSAMAGPLDRTALDLTRIAHLNGHRESRLLHSIFIHRSNQKDQNKGVLKVLLRDSFPVILWVQLDGFA